MQSNSARNISDIRISKQSAQSAAVRAADPRIPPQNYLLQNSDGNVDLYDATDKMEQEYREFRKIHLSQNILQQKMLLPCGAEGQLDADRRTGFEVGFEE